MSSHSRFQREANLRVSDQNSETQWLKLKPWSQASDQSKNKPSSNHSKIKGKTVLRSSSSTRWSQNSSKKKSTARRCNSRGSETTTLKFKTLWIKTRLLKRISGRLRSNLKRHKLTSLTTTRETVSTWSPSKINLWTDSVRSLSSTGRFRTWSERLKFTGKTSSLGNNWTQVRP